MVGKVRLGQLHNLLLILTLKYIVVDVVVCDDGVVVDAIEANVRRDVVGYDAICARVRLIQRDERRGGVLGGVGAFDERRIGDFRRKIFCWNRRRTQHQLLLHLMPREKVRRLEVLAADAVVTGHIAFNAQHLDPLLSVTRHKHKRYINTLYVCISY